MATRVNMIACMPSSLVRTRRVPVEREIINVCDVFEIRIILLIVIKNPGI